MTVLGFELGTNKDKSCKRLGSGLNLGPLDYNSRTLTARLHCLLDSQNGQLYRLEHLELVARQILIQVSATVTACLNRHRISRNIGKYHGMNFCMQNSSSGLFICPSHSRMKSGKNSLDLCLIMAVPK